MIKKISKNIGNIIFWIGIFVIILTNILVRPFGNLDEIWNFNFARGISNGLIPYKDINMVITPFLSYIVAFFLKLFGQEVFVTRIVASVISLINLILIYRICRNINIFSGFSRLMIIVIVLIMKDYYCIDYNFFTTTLTLGIILLEIKKIKNNNVNNQNITKIEEKNRNEKDIEKSLEKNYKFSKEINKYDFFIGILAGLCFCTKQSIGGIICIFVVISQLIIPNEHFSVFSTSKSLYFGHIKIKLKNILIRCIGIIIPIFIFFIYLIITNSFNEFWDYCILGIKTFSNKIEYVTLFDSKNKVIKILSKTVPICFIIILLFNIWLKLRKKEDKILNLLILYCIPVFMIVYPISDEIHFFNSILIWYILIGYVLNNLILKINNHICGRYNSADNCNIHGYVNEIYTYNKPYDFNINLKKTSIFFEAISILCVFYIIYYSEITIKNNYNDLINLKNYTSLNHFYYIKIDDNMVDMINEVDNYIISQDVNTYILDSQACVYMIPINRYNKNYDLFLKGNLGSGGEEKQIEILKNEKKYNKYLILKKKYKLNWQSAESVINYVRNNYKKVNSVGIFDVYEKK